MSCVLYGRVGDLFYNKSRLADYALVKVYFECQVAFATYPRPIGLRYFTFHLTFSVSGAFCQCRQGSSSLRTVPGVVISL